MFRPGGQGELYAYIPPTQNRPNICGVSGLEACYVAPDGITYGYSMGTGLWTFATGAYTTVRQVIHLNTPGVQDGWVKIFINGDEDPIFTNVGLSFRSSATSVVMGMQMQTFHGGHEPNVRPSLSLCLNLELMCCCSGHLATFRSRTSETFHS